MDMSEPFEIVITLTGTTSMLANIAMIVLIILLGATAWANSETIKRQREYTEILLRWIERYSGKDND